MGSGGSAGICGGARNGVLWCVEVIAVSRCGAVEQGKCCGFSEWLALHERRFSCAVLMCASTRAQEYGKVDL